MTSQFRKLAPVLCKLIVTLCTPLILFSGIMLFDTNDLYIWYMMHCKSLFAAVASFLSILALYILAISVDLSGLDLPTQTREVYTPVRDHSTEEDKAARTPVAFIQLPEPKVKKADDEDKDKSSFYITQLERLRSLQGMNAISNDEFQHLKSMILEKIDKILHDDKRD